MIEKLWAVCVSRWPPALLLLCRHPCVSYRAFLPSTQLQLSQGEEGAKTKQSPVISRPGTWFCRSHLTKSWAWQLLSGWFGPAEEEGNRYRDIISSWTRSMRSKCAGNSQHRAHRAASLLPSVSLLIPCCCLFLSQPHLLLSAFSLSSANTLDLGDNGCSLQNESKEPVEPEIAPH